MGSLLEQLRSLKEKVEEQLQSIEPDDLQSSSKDEQLSQLNVAGEGLKTLRLETSRSATSLPSHSLLQVQEWISQLDSRFQQIKTSISPPAKFSFRQRNQKPHTTPSSISSSSTTCTTHSSSSSSLQPQPSKAWSLSNQSDIQLQCDSSECSKKDILLSDLTRCDISLPYITQAFRAKNLHDCKISTGPIISSALLDNCINCTFQLVAQQVRIHSTKDSVFHLLVKTGPIIEESSGLQFGVYQPSHPGFASQIQEAGMETMVNRFKEVQDFNWANPNQPSPHWSLLPTTTTTTMT